MNTKQIVNHLSLVKRLRNTEHFDFYENINKRLVARTLTLTELRLFRDDFARAFRTEDTAYKATYRLEFKEGTRQVKAVLARRRGAYMELKRGIEMFTYCDDPHRRAAAQELTTVLDHYAGIYQAPMTEASALVTNMIQDMRTERFAPSLQRLQLQDTLARLEQVNDEFTTVYFDRASIRQDQSAAVALRAARRHTDLAFEHFATIVNALYRIHLRLNRTSETTAVLSELITEVNAYIFRYRAIYSRRTALAAHQSTQDTTTNESENPPSQPCPPQPRSDGHARTKRLRYLLRKEKLAH
ncbi:MAG: DUF6261 family protein [Tannerellaceae bacterium]|jgi:hypothetical protein|nr:DUF6261 family protein [Tannerellaceae bacterium]